MSDEDSLNTATEESVVEPVDGADSAPASEGQHEEKVIFDEAQQAKVDEIIGKKTYEARQRERELEAEREALRKQLEEVSQQVPQNERPAIPPVPDPFDDDYDEQIKARDAALLKAAEFDAQQSLKAEQSKREQEQKMLQEAKALEERAQTHAEKAKKLNVTDEELAQSQKVLVNFGISPEIAEYILDDDQGPLIQRYLAQHPQELDQVVRMPSHRGLIHLATEIKSKAAVKTTSNAPEPPDMLEGGGSPPSKRGPAGLTIE
jgi:multidrug efflux pump subunit AcrB